MPNVTISVTREIYEEMAKYPVNWSAVCRICIKKYLKVCKRTHEEFEESLKSRKARMAVRQKEYGVRLLLEAGELPPYK